MSSLAELPELVGFFSYSRKDDELSQGSLTKLRASIYNAFPLEGCQVLAGFMNEFAAKNG